MTDVIGDDTQTLGACLTQTLFERTSDRMNVLSEMEAFNALSTVLEDESGAVRQFLNVAKRASRAGSAGVSLLQHRRTGEPDLVWKAVSGQLADHEGAEAACDLSPCGVCMSANAPVLVSRPELAFNDLKHVMPQITEMLIVPLHDGKKVALGTLWVAHHQPAAHFCSDDARVIERLSTQLMLAMSLSKESKLQRRDAAPPDSALEEPQRQVEETLRSAIATMSQHANASSWESRSVSQAMRKRSQSVSQLEMALLAEGNHDQVFLPALLRAVVKSSREAFADLSERVAVTLNCAAVSCHWQDALRLALLTNEAVTNACLHGFPRNGTGNISIELRRGPEGSLILQVADDGVGFSIFSMDGLGLQLAHAFADQLQGFLSVDRPYGTSGTLVTLVIPGPAPAESPAAIPLNSMPART